MQAHEAVLLPEELQITGPEPVWIDDALHRLCQPLTALQCGLFIGTMSPDGIRTPTSEELLTTIRLALVQCERVCIQVRAMQEELRSTS